MQHKRRRINKKKTQSIVGVPDEITKIIFEYKTQLEYFAKRYNLVMRGFFDVCNILVRVHTYFQGFVDEETEDVENSIVKHHEFSRVMFFRIKERQIVEDDDNVRLERCQKFIDDFLEEWDDIDPTFRYICEKEKSRKVSNFCLLD